jgi:hypothetical protein
MRLELQDETATYCLDYAYPVVHRDRRHLDSCLGKKPLACRWLGCRLHRPVRTPMGWHRRDSETEVNMPCGTKKKKKKKK